MNRYLPLKKGDKISIITPAGAITAMQAEQVQKNVAELDLIPVFSDSLMHKFGYFSGTIQQRLEELYEAFENPETKLILCARGGFGTTTLLKSIDYERIAKNPKPIVGMSDITALLLTLHARANVPAYHGIVGISEFTSYTKTGFRSVLMSEAHNININSYQFNSEIALYQSFTIVSGKANGKLIGGNLSLLTSLLGTPFDTDWAGKIVFIEDVNEAPYAIDRMLTQLFNAGKFENVAAVIFGVFAGCEPRDEQSFTLPEVLTRLFSGFGVPVVYGFSFGHIVNQAIFPIDAQADFDTVTFSLSIKDSI